MNKYLAETQYAARGLIDLYMHEILAYMKAERDFVAGAEAVKAWNAQPAGKDFLQAGLGVLLLQQLPDMTKNTEQMRESAGKTFALDPLIKTRTFAHQVLCGALLQIAKQGISVTYGHEWKTNCPEGRAIGSETLRNIIWQGRNHSMHYEEKKKPDEATRQCFANLEALDARISLSSQPSTNFAAHVIDLLQWHSYAEYENDMTSLLGT